jgi:hypothetical protein
VDAGSNVGSGSEVDVGSDEAAKASLSELGAGVAFVTAGSAGAVDAVSAVDGDAESPVDPDIDPAVAAGGAPTADGTVVAAAGVEATIDAGATRAAGVPSLLGTRDGSTPAIAACALVAAGGSVAGGGSVLGSGVASALGATAAPLSDVDADVEAAVEMSTETVPSDANATPPRTPVAASAMTHSSVNVPVRSADRKPEHVRERPVPPGLTSLHRHDPTLPNTSDSTAPPGSGGVKAMFPAFANATQTSVG